MRLKYFLFIATAALMVTGCIKERGNNFANQVSVAPNTVDFPNQTEAASLDIVTTPTIYTFYVEASTTNGVSNPTVTIAKNVSIVTAAGFEFLPDSAYTLVSTTSAVDPKTGLAPFQLKVNTTKIDLSHNFAVGYTITSTSAGVIATNKNTDVISIGAKNRYDGIYSLHINTVGWGAYGIADNQPADYPGEFQLITAGPNSVGLNNPNYSGQLQPALTSGGGATAFGSTQPLYLFDLSTNKVIDVQNLQYPNPRGRNFALNTTVSNYFDPATKTIYVNYTMVQNGRPTQYIYETFTFLRSR